MAQEKKESWKNEIISLWGKTGSGDESGKIVVVGCGDDRSSTIPLVPALSS